MTTSSSLPRPPSAPRSVRALGAAPGPELHRAQRLDRSTRERTLAELDLGVKRLRGVDGPAPGLLCAVGALCTDVQERALGVAEQLIHKRAFARPLLAGCVRVVEYAAPALQEKLAAALLPALLREEPLLLDALLVLIRLGHAGASSALAQAPLQAALARLAVHKQTVIAFAASYIRLQSAECAPEHLAALASRLKESNRIALVERVFVPLARSTAGSSPRPAQALLATFAALRGSERHLGRWLPLAELGKRTGDARVLLDAQERTKVGPAATRSAWAHLAWALQGKSQLAKLAASKPTVDLMARLSDRPSSDRDMTFLFRLGEAGVPSARPLLESFAADLTTEVAIRSAVALALGYADASIGKRLLRVATHARPEDLRGLAVAALWDVAAALRDTALRDAALDHACTLMVSKDLSNVAWSALVRSAASTRSAARMVSDAHVRALRWGMID